MSTLWTPGGEVPVERDRPRSAQPETDAAPGAPTDPPPGQDGPRQEVGAPSEEELRQRADALQQYLLEAPAAEVITQHAVGLYELAALHVSQPEPRLADARLAIEALRSLLEGIGDDLGDAGAELRRIVPQLQMAFVQASDRSGDGGHDGPAPPPPAG